MPWGLVDGGVFVLVNSHEHQIFFYTGPSHLYVGLRSWKRRVNRESRQKRTIFPYYFDFRLSTPENRI